MAPLGKYSKGEKKERERCDALTVPVGPEKKKKKQRNP